jgi:hypothetical protein
LANSRRGPGRAGRNPAALLMSLRQLHSYVGAFIAPSLLFFAVTGALQVFNLHEAHGDYRPPELVVRLSRVHKDQVFSLPRARAPQAAAHPDPSHDPGPRAEAPHMPHAPPWSALALKWLFLAVAAGLTLSTLMGLWIAFATARRKGVILALFALGAALPIALVALQ